MDDLFESTSWEQKQISVITESLLKIATNSSVKAELSEIDPYVKDLKSALKEGEIPTIERGAAQLIYTIAWDRLYILCPGKGNTYKKKRIFMLPGGAFTAD